jgi:hypothetical protein
MAALRQLRPDLTMQVAKAMLDAVPCIVKSNIPLEGKKDAKRAFAMVADVELVNDTYPHQAAELQMLP